MDIVSLEASDVLPWERVSGPGDSSYSHNVRECQSGSLSETDLQITTEDDWSLPPNKASAERDLILSLVLFLAV